jgi:hypothetical protein
MVIPFLSFAARRRPKGFYFYEMLLLRMASMTRGCGGNDEGLSDLFQRGPNNSSRQLREGTRSSNIEYRISNIEYRISNIEYRISNIKYRISNIEYRMLFVFSRGKRKPFPLPIPPYCCLQITCSLQHPSTWPVSFSQVGPGDCCDLGSSQCLYNSELTWTANMLTHFDWAIYGFNSRHFVSVISKRGMLFCVVLACDPYSNRRTLFWSMTLCKHILDGASLLLDRIRHSGIMSKLTGYIIHSQRQSSTEPTKQFWDIQSQIVTQLRIARALLLVVAFVHPDHDN